MPMMVITIEGEVTGITMNVIGMEAGMIGVDIGIMMMDIGNSLLLKLATGRECMCRHHHRYTTLHPHQFTMHRHLVLVFLFHLLLYGDLPSLKAYPHARRGGGWGRESPGTRL